MGKNKGSKGTTYMLDNNLVPRVRALLSTLDERDLGYGGSIDTNQVCEMLKDRFKEYHRRPTAAFQMSVDKALSIIQSEAGDDTLIQTLDIVPPAVPATPSEPEQNNSKNMNSTLLSMYSRTVSPSTASADASSGTPNNPIELPADNAITPSNINKKLLKTSQETPTQKKRGSVDVTNGTPSTTPTSSQPKKRIKASVELSADKDGNVDMSMKVVSVTPTVRYEDVGGIEPILQTIRETIEHPILHPEIYRHLGVKPPRGVLLCGPPGCGKTLLANAIAGELGVPFFSISAPEVISGMSGESEAKIRSLFTDAMAQAPSLIFIDEIDSITPKRENAQREMEKRIVAQFLTCMDLIEHNPNGAVIVLGATNRPESLDPALRRAGRFDKEIIMGIPDARARCKILQVLSQKMKLAGDFDFMEIAVNTPGFVGADLSALTKEAAVLAINRIFSNLDTPLVPGTPNGADQPAIKAEHDELTPMQIDAKTKEAELAKRSQTSNALRAHVQPLSEEQLAPLYISMDDFKIAVKKVQPSAKREGFATIPNVTWEDIGALKTVRRELELSILQPIKQPDRYKNMGLNPSAGVLMYGPPGCGKTLLAKAIANECQANFISVKGPELLNKYVGESERAVRQVFQRAGSSAPCVIFFDELDALAPRRNSDENESSKRVVNMLLTEMDGLERRTEVFVIAATNRPDMIDPALLRPGRLDKCLCVSLPDAADRVDILKTITHATPVDNTVDFQKIGSDPRADGFSGADLAQLVKEAAVYALSIAPLSQTRVCVSAEHFEYAFTKVFPSVSKKDAKAYSNLRRSLPGGDIGNNTSSNNNNKTEPTQ